MDDTNLSEDGQETNRKIRVKKKYVGLFSIICAFLVCIAVFLMHPYKKAEKLAGDVLVRYAPTGTTVGGISIGFPFNIVLSNLIVPVQVHDWRRQLMVEKISGKVSILSLLQGNVDVGMNADFFGGICWLDVKAEPVTKDIPENLSFVVFDARARKLDVAQVCTFLETPFLASGICNVDVEGELDERDLSSLKGKALVICQELAIPPILIKSIVLPGNPDARFTAKLSAKGGKIFVDKFNLNGSTYNLSGKGIMQISDPLDNSPVDGSFSMVFDEAPMIVDERFAEAGAEQILETLVETDAEVFFKVSGTAKKPEVQLDSATSLGSLLERAGR